MKLNLNLIEKDPVLRNRLKEAAKESVRDFFQNRDPPEEALEYVVAAICLGETNEQFNERLQLLFEKDCTPIVDALNAFVSSHPEFTLPPEKETKKEDGKNRRQRIVWDATLDKKTEPSSEEKKKPRTKQKPSSKEEIQIKGEPAAETPVRQSKRSLHGTQKRDVCTERWKMESEEAAVTSVALDGEQEMKPPRAGAALKVPRSRLFQSALGSIRQQRGKDVKSDGDLGADRKIERPIRVRKEPALPLKPSLPEEPPTVPPAEGSILNRIRKPDGSAFEEWELKREAPRGRKRQADAPRGQESTPPGPPADLSEVESLKLKIARLEEEFKSAKAPVPVRHYLPVMPHRMPIPDVDRFAVCVKNVHFQANEEVLQAHFHSCSPIVNIQFAKNQFGQSKGFCFIQFAYEDCVERALELDQSILLGRKISVVQKLTRPPGPSPAKSVPTGEWTRTPWKSPTEAVPPEPWRNGSAETALEPQEIQDFAIDTGSQELP